MAEVHVGKGDPSSGTAREAWERHAAKTVAYQQAKSRLARLCPVTYAEFLDEEWAKVCVERGIEP